jgi:hypothetical protein
MSNQYRPAGVNKEFADIMERARQTNRHRDAIAKSCRSQVPRECGPAMYLAAAMEAVETGVRVTDWDSVAEGLAMLEDLQAKYALVLGSKKKVAQEPTSV